MKLCRRLGTLAGSFPWEPCHLAKYPMTPSLWEVGVGVVCVGWRSRISRSVGRWSGRSRCPPRRAGACTQTGCLASIKRRAGQQRGHSQYPCPLTVMSGRSSRRPTLARHGAAVVVGVRARGCCCRRRSPALLMLLLVLASRAGAARPWRLRRRGPPSPFTPGRSLFDCLLVVVRWLLSVVGWWWMEGIDEEAGDERRSIQNLQAPGKHARTVCIICVFSESRASFASGCRFNRSPNLFAGKGRGAAVRACASPRTHTPSNSAEEARPTASQLWTFRPIPPYAPRPSLERAERVGPSSIQHDGAAQTQPRPHVGIAIVTSNINSGNRSAMTSTQIPALLNHNQGALPPKKARRQSMQVDSGPRQGRKASRAVHFGGPTIRPPFQYVGPNRCVETGCYVQMGRTNPNRSGAFNQQSSVNLVLFDRSLRLCF